MPRPFLPLLPSAQPAKARVVLTRPPPLPPSPCRRTVTYPWTLFLIWASWLATLVLDGFAVLGVQPHGYVAASKVGAALRCAALSRSIERNLAALQFSTRIGELFNFYSISNQFSSMTLQV
jgi:hypothetical protein